MLNCVFKSCSLQPALGLVLLIVMGSSCSKTHFVAPKTLEQEQVQKTTSSTIEKSSEVKKHSEQSSETCHANEEKQLECVQNSREKYESGEIALGENTADSILFSEIGRRFFLKGAVEENQLLNKQQVSLINNSQDLIDLIDSCGIAFVDEIAGPCALNKWSTEVSTRSLDSGVHLTVLNFFEQESPRSFQLFVVYQKANYSNLNKDQIDIISATLAQVTDEEKLSGVKTQSELNQLIFDQFLGVAFKRPVHLGSINAREVMNYLSEESYPHPLKIHAIYSWLENCQGKDYCRFLEKDSQIRQINYWQKLEEKKASVLDYYESNASLKDEFSSDEKIGLTRLLK